MNIAKTVYPESVPSFNDWAQEFRVSSQVSKFDGQAKAEHMMQHWGGVSVVPRTEVTESYLSKLVTYIQSILFNLN